MTNPYVNRAALKSPEDFFGRVRELRDIYQLLLRGLCISLVGERRVGKTSLLYALASEQKHHAFGIPADLRFVNINAQYFSGGDEPDFVEFLLDQCSLELGTVTHGQDRELLRKVAGEIAGKGLRLVLMIDEVDVLVQNPRFTPMFFSYLRAWTEQFQIPFVVASREGSVDLLVETAGAGSPFWNIFKPVYIGPLESDEAQQLVRTPAARLGLPFTDEEVKAILNLGGTHPFFLQIACDHWFATKAVSRPVSAGRLEAAFYAEALPHLTYLLGRLSDTEQRAVRHLAERRPVDRRMTGDLLRKGVLVDDSGQLRPFSTMLVRALRERDAASQEHGSLAQRATRFLFR